ncbi:MAG: NAD(P)/FAD-dependent oxidoreductase, partial [Oscillospiraceae bacterium]
KLRGGVEQLILANRIALIRGEAQIAAPGRVTVTSDGEIRTLTADHILIATGAKPVCPPIAGRELPGVVTSDGLLTGSPRFPEKLVIVGGGVIGVEFASAFSAFGSHVTLIEALPRLLANMDRELSQNLSMILKKRGVELVTDAAVERIEQIPDGLLCRFSHRGESASVQADQLLIATGRRADTEGLFADGLLIERDRGALRVNERFETSVPGIYAIGDAMAGGIQLAHAASAQGENAVAAICGEPMPVNLAAVPSCVYTDPE